MMLGRLAAGWQYFVHLAPGAKAQQSRPQTRTDLTVFEANPIQGYDGGRIDAL